MTETTLAEELREFEYDMIAEDSETEEEFEARIDELDECCDREIIESFAICCDCGELLCGDTMLSLLIASAQSMDHFLELTAQTATADLN